MNHHLHRYTMAIFKLIGLYWLRYLVNKFCIIATRPNNLCYLAFAIIARIDLWAINLCGTTCFKIPSLMLWQIPDLIRVANAIIALATRLEVWWHQGGQGWVTKTVVLISWRSASQSSWTYHYKSHQYPLYTYQLVKYLVNMWYRKMQDHAPWSLAASFIGRHQQIIL